MTAARTITFTLNGAPVTADVKPHHNLVELLQTQFGLTGARESCGQGLCGCCTVLVNGRAVSGCLYLAQFVDGAEVTTVESLDTRDKLSPVQEAFIEASAFQCGYCTPGFIMMVTQLLDEHPDPNDDQIKHYLSGNLCRCATYPEGDGRGEARRQEAQGRRDALDPRTPEGLGAAMSTAPQCQSRNRRAGDRLRRGRHVCRDRGRARRLPRAPDRPEPDRPRRRDRDGADDGGGGARRRGAGPLVHHYQDTLDRRPRALQRAAVAPALRARPRLHPRDGAWGVGWARKNGKITSAFAPGHDRPRCVYVDFLNTGPAVSKTLRTVVHKLTGIRRAGDLCVVDLIKRRWRGHRRGGVARRQRRAGGDFRQGDHRRHRRADAALPPQQRLANMGGDGYALCLRAGAPLIDMEFVQFFPIGHLAPRLIGMDPIMWDPFRYKLGGRLLNNDMQQFTDRYGVPEDGKYVITRDVGTYAIIKEVEAGRGSPHGGAYLSFQHVPEAKLREAFGPVIDRLAANGIDLTKMPVEVAPIAHYHMGGVPTDVRMQTELPGLLVAGEAVGGANGANRLSGNAITEALVFGRQAGRTAAARAKTMTRRAACTPAQRGAAIDLIRAPRRPKDAPNTAEMLQRLQAVHVRRRRPAAHDGHRCNARSARIDEMTRRYRRAAVRRRRRLRHGSGSTGSTCATC